MVSPVPAPPPPLPRARPARGCPRLPVQSFEACRDQYIDFENRLQPLIASLREGAHVNPLEYTGEKVLITVGFTARRVAVRVREEIAPSGWLGPIVNRIVHNRAGSVSDWEGLLKAALSRHGQVGNNTPRVSRIARVVRWGWLQRRQPSALTHTRYPTESGAPRDARPAHLRPADRDLLDVGLEGHRARHPHRRVHERHRGAGTPRSALDVRLPPHGVNVRERFGRSPGMLRPHQGPLAACWPAVLPGTWRACWLLVRAAARMEIGRGVARASKRAARVLGCLLARCWAASRLRHLDAHPQ